MKKITIIILGVLALTGVAYATGIVDNKEPPSWRYKMTVTVETPEGDVSGSAVRQMGNEPGGSFIPEVGNPADVRGEAVVVDLGERGTLFTLIGHDSDLEFYATFPAPNGGGSTREGIEYYDKLPIGTSAPLGTDRYLRVVTFTDMEDPKSVTMVYDRDICARAPDTEEECKGKNMGLLQR